MFGGVLITSTGACILTVLLVDKQMGCECIRGQAGIGRLFVENFEGLLAVLKLL
jgi:hypothetical protein